MANRNDYNYYKNEYGKYKANYYSPGSEEYKKRQSGSRKQKAARIIRAFFVFIIIAAIVVGVVFGIIKLSSAIRERTTEEETTTQVTTTQPESTSKKDNSKYKKGTVCVVKTEEGTGVNLRSEPTYEVAGYQLVSDGEKIVIAELSKDGKWCKTSNFDKDGWLNLKYLKIVKEEDTTKKQETTTEKPTKAETTTKKPETTTEGKTEKDDSIKSYADAVKAFKEKGNGASMNCKVVGGDCMAKASADPNSTNIFYLLNGENVKVTAVSGNYSKINKSGISAWVSNESLSFVSWG